MHGKYDCLLWNFSDLVAMNYLIVIQIFITQGDIGMNCISSSKSVIDTYVHQMTAVFWIEIIFCKILKYPEICVIYNLILWRLMYQPTCSARNISFPLLLTFELNAFTLQKRTSVSVQSLYELGLKQTGFYTNLLMLVLMLLHCFTYV